jgi:trk system potassium uptake protein TrkH
MRVSVPGRVVAVPQPRMAVRVGAALNLIGFLTKYLSLAFLFPLAIALGYGETPVPFLVPMLAMAASGIALERVTNDREHVGSREVYLVVSLIWLLLAAFGAGPYLLAGDPQLNRPVDAFFESMSGFTTTGASVVTDYDRLSHSMAMWRQFTMWLGGMGVIVLFLAVLPRLRVGGRQLFSVEAPGPEVNLQSRVRDVAKRFLLVYLLLTALEVAALTFLGYTEIDPTMGPYDAVAAAFATIPTGGFLPYGNSAAAFGAASQWTIAVFMVLAGTNFVLLYAALVRGRLRELARNEELRVYLFLLAAASAVVLVELLQRGLAGGEAAARHAVFNTVSILTTTGFASADFALWTGVTSFVLVGLMFVGASAGSTSGSIKVVRHLVISRMLRREIDQTIHPELVSPLRLDGRVIDERALRSMIVFGFLYVGIAFAGALVVLLDSARIELSVSAFESLAASATTLGNVGPGLGLAGPFGSFAPFSDLSTIAMAALMWLGRLEILPIVVLFARGFWRA